jgi:hypothetical protein
VLVVETRPEIMSVKQIAEKYPETFEQILALGERQAVRAGRVIPRKGIPPYRKGCFIIPVAR